MLFLSAAIQKIWYHFQLYKSTHHVEEEARDEIEYKSDSDSDSSEDKIEEIEEVIEINKLQLQDESSISSMKNKYIDTDTASDYQTSSMLAVLFNEELACLIATYI